MRRDILLGALIASILHITVAVYSHWTKLPARIRIHVAALDPVPVKLLPPELPEVIPDDPQDTAATPPPPVAPDPLRLTTDKDFVINPDPPRPSDINPTFAVKTVPAGDFGASARRVFTSIEVDQVPQAVLQGPAEYPASLKAQHVTGEVVVRFVVDANNSVRDVRVVSSTARGFDVAAVQAVQKWKFKAGTKAGKAVPVQLEVPIRFNLK